MRFALPVLLLAFALPSAAQTTGLPSPGQIREQRIFKPQFPPDIISQPERVRVEIDNEMTRVLRITLPPDGQVTSHDDRAGVLVCLTECHLRILVSGAPVEVNLRPGQTQWIKADPRSMRNVGSDLAEMLYIERK